MKILRFFLSGMFAIAVLDASTQAASLPLQGQSNMSRIRSLFEKLKSLENESFQEDESEAETEVFPVSLDLDGPEIFSEPGILKQKAQEFISSKPAQVLETEPVAAHVATPLSLSSGGEEFIYTISPGDSLLLIARKFYKDPSKFKEIMQWNNLKTEQIYPGQKLMLKNVSDDLVREKTLIQAEQERALFSESEYRFLIYQVVSGDTLAGIAKKFTGKASNYRAISQLNKMNAGDILKVGMKIVIPVKK